MVDFIIFNLKLYIFDVVVGKGAAVTYFYT